MAAAPVFAVTPRIGMAQVSTANTARDGTGTLADVLTGGSSGTKISEVIIEATGVTTAGMVRLFLYDGTNTRMFDEISVAAQASPSASTKVTRLSTLYQNLTLPSNSWVLKASTHNAETINVFALGADL